MVLRVVCAVRKVSDDDPVPERERLAQREALAALAAAGLCLERRFPESSSKTVPRQPGLPGCQPKPSAPWRDALP